MKPFFSYHFCFSGYLHHGNLGCRLHGRKATFWLTAVEASEYNIEVAKKRR